MDNPKTEVIQSLKDAQNVLVTVSQNPSVDQLAAAIGITLVLNKLGKHGSAVFSGAVPSTIEFLKPEEILEKNTDSLRDFIISLDKAKADKLRYKVEDQHVKIFITPYRTTLGQEDLIFSHGDFNVDVVLALGVHEQNELDSAITAHGRILHDAKIVSVNVGKAGELGGINLNEQNTSSLSEVLAGISVALKADVFDAQIATAFLTGIVAETDRFSNEKTKPETMSVSAKLMSAGANQQLVATKLEIPATPLPTADDSKMDSDPNATESKESIKHDDGSLDIKHELPAPQAEEPQHPHEIQVDEEGNFKSSHIDELPKIQKDEKTNLEEGKNADNGSLKRQRMILEPPSKSGTLTASGKEEPEETTDPLSLPPVDGPILSHEDKSAKPPLETKKDETKSNKPFAKDDQTLDSLEKAVKSTHQSIPPEAPKKEEQSTEPEQKPEGTQAPDIDDLKTAVDQALADAGDQKPLDPIKALNANPVDLDLGHDEQNQTEPSSPVNQENQDYLDVTKLDSSTGLPSETPPAPEPSRPKFPPDPKPGPSTDAVGPAAPPPPVPPPMMPPLSNNENDDDHQSLPPVPPL